MDSELVRGVQGSVSKPEGPPWRQTESEPERVIDAPVERVVLPAGSRLAYLFKGGRSARREEEGRGEVKEVGVFKLTFQL